MEEMMTIIAGVAALIIASLLMIFIPDKLWHIKYMWISDGGSPSDMYIQATRVGGVALFVLSMFLLVAVVLIQIGN